MGLAGESLFAEWRKSATIYLRASWSHFQENRAKTESPPYLSKPGCKSAFEKMSKPFLWFVRWNLSKYGNCKLRKLIPGVVLLEATLCHRNCGQFIIPRLSRQQSIIPQFCRQLANNGNNIRSCRGQMFYTRACFPKFSKERVDGDIWESKNGI